MSEDNGSASGAPQVSGGNEGEKPNQNPDKNTVSYETFQKVLDEKKRLQAEFEATKAQKLEDLKSAGKFEELYKNELQARQKIESDLKIKDATYTLETANSAFEIEAVKAGCQRPDHLRKLIGDDELAKTVGQNFRPEADLIKRLIESSQKEFSYLFDKAAPKFRDAPPASGVQQPKKIDDMSTGELMAEIRKLSLKS